MRHRVYCPGCQKAYWFPENAAGKYGVCGACGERVTADRSPTSCSRVVASEESSAANRPLTSDQVAELHPPTSSEKRCHMIQLPIEESSPPMPVYRRQPRKPRRDRRRTKKILRSVLRGLDVLGTLFLYLSYAVLIFLGFGFLAALLMLAQQLIQNDSRGADDRSF